MRFTATSDIDRSSGTADNQGEDSAHPRYRYFFETLLVTSNSAKPIVEVATSGALVIDRSSGTADSQGEVLRHLNYHLKQVHVGRQAVPAEKVIKIPTTAPSPAQT